MDEQLVEIFKREGLEVWGVADFREDASEAQARYHQWLSEGRHGTMEYLERHEPAKYSPQAFFPETRCLLVAALNYFQKRPGEVTGLPTTSPLGSNGLVAKYAWGRDYHKVFLKKLQRTAENLKEIWPEETFRVFTDTAPLDERYWATRAGVGFQGKNTLSISEPFGSWFFLGEILSSRIFEVEPVPPKPRAHRACPSGCHRCKNVCPTGALDNEYRIDASLCISYLTIEHKGSIPVELRPKMGGWIFGCDLCQDVCPFNLKVPVTAEPDFKAWKAGPSLELDSILSLPDDEAFTARFGGSPVHRAGRTGLIRNACIASANLGRKDLLPVLRRLADNSDAVVAETAQWAVKILEKDYTEA